VRAQSAAMTGRMIRQSAEAAAATTRAIWTLTRQVLTLWGTRKLISQRGWRAAAPQPRLIARAQRGKWRKVKRRLW
jgi:hypothetical protein